MVAFSAAIVLIIILAGLAAQTLNESVATQIWVEHTYVVLNRIHRTVAQISTVRNDVQGYVITGDDRYRAQSHRAISAVISDMQDLKETNSADPQEFHYAVELDRAMRAMVNQMAVMLVRRQIDGFDAARTLYTSRVSEVLSARIDALAGAMVRAETGLLASRTKSEVDSRRHLLFVISALAGVVIATVLIGFIRLRREIKSRRQLAESHASQENFLESVLNHIPLPIWIKDPASLRLLAVNSAMERWLGRPREQLIGLATEEIFTAEDARASIELDRRALASRDVITAPADSRIGPDGRPVTLFTRKVAVRNPDGHPACILCITEDVSEKLADEQRIRDLNAALQVQKSDLEIANRELESFSYSVSHDLRSPLRAIDGFSMMLLEDYGPRMDPEAQRYLTTIRTGVKHMGQLIDDLLALAKVGRQPLQRAFVDVTRLAREAANDAVRDMGETVPTIVIDTMPGVHGDESLLKQVWINLISNAVKYSAKTATPIINVKSYSVDGDVVYAVHDNGAGFDMKFAHKLFKVFQRLHGEDEFPGTGVGLAIVHRIIARHDGRVWAESSPGRGAVFKFTVGGASSS